MKHSFHRKKQVAVNAHTALRQHPILKYPYKGIIIGTGGIVILAGIAMLVLPGPGIATILLGMGILSLELSMFAKWLLAIRLKALAVRRKTLLYLGKRRKAKSTHTHTHTHTHTIRNDVYV